MLFFSFLTSPNFIGFIRPIPISDQQKTTCFFHCFISLFGLTVLWSSAFLNIYINFYSRQKYLKSNLFIFLFILFCCFYILQVLVTVIIIFAFFCVSMLFDALKKNFFLVFTTKCSKKVRQYNLQNVKSEWKRQEGQKEAELTINGDSHSKFVDSMWKLENTNDQFVWIIHCTKFLSKTNF